MVRVKRSEESKKQQADYDKATYKKYVFRLNKNTEKDLIGLLEKQENKQGFIKNFLEEYLKNEKK